MTDDMPLEAVLDEIVAEDGDDTAELVAFRFYLQALLGRSSAEGVSSIGGVTNHVTLVRRLERWRRRTDPDNPILYVTFNYDTILDQALGTVHAWGKRPREQGLVGYVEDARYRLYKLHGSVDWGHPTSVPTPRSFGNTVANIGNDEALVEEARAVLIASASAGTLRIRTEDFRRMPDFGEYSDDWEAHPGSTSGLMLPALAVPLRSKAEFLCPAAHVEQMLRDLREVDRIIAIGWKAGEPDFVSLLSSVQPQPYLMTVTRSPASRRRISDVIRAATVGMRDQDWFNNSEMPAAFSALAAGSELDRFLAQP